MEPAPRLFHQFPLLRTYMTTTPITIDPAQPLSEAQRLMGQHGIRHLPVLDRGVLVGLISQRDALVVASLPGADPTRVAVADAMARDLLTARPDTPLAEVVEAMIDRKAGSAIAVEDGRVVGVLTTIDALQALVDRLTAPG